MATANPFSGESWAEVADDPAAVDDAVQAARRAFTDGPWATMPATERARMMRRLGELLTRDAEQLGQAETRDNGKIIRETSAQAKGLQGYYDFFAGMADKIGGEQLPSPSPNFLVYTEREPIGVVGAIIPWNSPLALLTWKLAPLLAAGCTVVVKPSDITPVTALMLAERTAEAGFPPGVVNVVTGGAEVGAAITAHPDIDKITFTGGGATAKHVARAAADNLTPTVLELGGKSPQIIFADADPEAVTNGLLAGIFAASGQTCIAGSRAYIHRDIFDEVIGRVVARANELVLGDPSDSATEMGPSASSDAQRDRILAMIDLARSEGATIAAGGVVDPDLGGRFVRPTVITGVTNQSTIVREEVFGPVLAVLDFEDEDEVVKLAQRQRLRTGGGRLDQRHPPGPPSVESATGGHSMDQHLPQRELHGPLRRLQAIRLRPRQRPRSPRRLPPNQDSLGRANRRHPRPVCYRLTATCPPSNCPSKSHRRRKHLIRLFALST